jgi:tetratricopeptide (TPR) repeat protein
MISCSRSPHDVSKPIRFVVWPLLAILAASGTLKGEDQALSAVNKSQTAPAADAPATPGPSPELAAVREAKGLVALGASLTDRGDYGAAEIAYRQVLTSKAPLENVKLALLGLARMHRKQGAPTKAAAVYERYLDNYPNDERVPDALLELGRTLRDMGAPRLAIARFYAVINSTLKLTSNGGFEHYQLLAKTAQFEVAETHFQSGEFTEANKFFSRLRMLDLAPSDRARAHFKAGYSLQLAGDMEGAITSLKAYLEQWPDDENVPEARYLLATTLRATKHPQESLTATLDLLRAEKSRSNADSKRWVYWQRRTGNQLANDFFQGGDILNALAIYHALAALTEDASWRVPATYQIGLCYERLGDIDRASKTYKNIVEIAGADATPEIADTVRMATSRLSHIDWKDATERQIAMLFDTNTGQTPTPPPKPQPAHDANRSPAATPAAL